MPAGPAGRASPGHAALSRWQWAALLSSLAVFGATWIAPLRPVDQALHSSLTVLGFTWLVLHARRWPMRDGDFIAICLFIAVHCVAARWLYSNVPYDAWVQWLTGWSPDAAFGWERNHFDRLVHLLYGLCFTPAVHHALRQHWPGMAQVPAFAVAVLLVMSTSLVYEWAEWGISLTMSPEAAEAYNGQQGDIWDAHMDMLLATVGALLAWPLLDRSAARGGPSR